VRPFPSDASAREEGFQNGFELQRWRGVCGGGASSGLASAVAVVTKVELEFRILV
jgi:hypothetical protein